MSMVNPPPKPAWQALLEPASMNAFLRHIANASATATAVAIIFGLSQGDATTIGSAIQQIGNGIAALVAGVTLMIPVVTGAYAAISATRRARMASLNADPQIKKVETFPGTEAHKEASEIPGNKVV
jgi:cephalosporin-C deacetylase-like acetyl esterase